MTQNTATEMPAEQCCNGKAFEYSESGMLSAWYKATVATYNNSTTKRFVPDTSGGPPRCRKSQQQ